LQEKGIAGKGEAKKALMAHPRNADSFRFRRRRK
jgi:hypothetical protein